MDTEFQTDHGIQRFSFLIYGLSKGGYLTRNTLFIQLKSSDKAFLNIEESINIQELDTESRIGSQLDSINEQWEQCLSLNRKNIPFEMLNK